MPRTAPVFIHLHVAKCSGSSINFTLTKRFQGRVLSHRDGLGRQTFANLSNAERDEWLDCVTGHFHFGLHEKFDREVIYFSVLREPLDRICSLFNFIHLRPQNPGHKILQAELLDLNGLTQEWLARRPGLSKQLSKQLSNQFCCVYGEDAVDDARYAALEARLAAMMRDGRFVVGALPRIERFMAEVGLIEAGTSLPHRNRESDHPFRSQHVRAAVDTLSDETRALLTALNTYDFKLLRTIAEVNRELGVESGPAPYIDAV